MSSPALLLFLELEGVLVLNESIKRSQVEDAIRTIASGKSRWKDYQELWDGLFEPAAVIQLKTLHDQFELHYCLTSEWTSMMDRTAMLYLLRLSGLGFVASNLHARWETRSAQAVSDRADAIENWLCFNPAHKGLWAALDSELHGSGTEFFSASHPEFSVVCCRDVGLTSFETGKLREAFLLRLRASYGEVMNSSM